MGRYSVQRTLKHPDDCGCPSCCRVRKMEQRLAISTGLVSLKEYAQRDDGIVFPFPPPTMWDLIRNAGYYANEQDMETYEARIQAERDRVQSLERYYAKKAATCQRKRYTRVGQAAARRS